MTKKSFIAPGQFKYFGRFALGFRFHRVDRRERQVLLALAVCFGGVAVAVVDTDKKLVLVHVRVECDVDAFELEKLGKVYEVVVVVVAVVADLDRLIQLVNLLLRAAHVHDQVGCQQRLLALLVVFFEINYLNFHEGKFFLKIPKI